MSNLKTLRKKILDAAETVIRESRMIDFKESINLDSKGDWYELIKDIIAIANSGGGALLISVKDDGKKSGYPHNNFLDYDSAFYLSLPLSLTLSIDKLYRILCFSLHHN